MENNLSVLIANENMEELDEISKKLMSENFGEVDKSTDGEEVLSLLENKTYDLLILDLILPSIDGFEIIERAKQINKSIKIIVISALSSDTFIKRATNLGADYYLLKPINLDILSKRINELLNEKTNAIMGVNAFVNKEIEEKISNIFITVGIPAHIKGYQFLREAIKLAMDNPDIINSITKKLYPSIAGKFDTSASKVERAIRHAIEVAWNRGKIENINSIFGLTVYSNNEKPTNGEFIALVADKMLLDV